MGPAYPIKPVLTALPSAPPLPSRPRTCSWVDKARRLRVLANVDTPEDAAIARANGAQGIGLCRTEHMFFSTHERIAAVSVTSRTRVGLPHTPADISGGS